MITAQKSELRRRAEQLAECVREIIRCLETHRGEPHQVECGKALAERLRPLVDAHDRAVFDARARDAAAEIVGALNDHVSHAGVLATKGEMGFQFGTAMNTYYDLHTIFREAQYRSESL